MFIAWIGALQLARSLWIPSFVTGLIIFVHHAVMIILNALESASGSSRDVGELDFASPEARAIEAVFVIVNLFLVAMFMTASIRHSERAARVDFVLKYHAKHRRNIAERLVDSMLPGPIAAEVRIAVENGLPPSLAWRFDSVCVLQSDIVGFTKCVSRARPPCRSCDCSSLYRPGTFFSNYYAHSLVTWPSPLHPHAHHCHLSLPILPACQRLGARATPEQLCRMLHELFSAFDEMSNVFGVYKIGALGVWTERAMRGWA